MQPLLSRVLRAVTVTSARPAALTLLSLVALTGSLGATGRTIVIGFDGLDHGYCTQLLEAGDLPNFARLAQQGTFAPLETSNPAESPVSWAVFNTGTNPGKTGVAGFVSRTFSAPGPKGEPPIPMPQPMLSFPTTVPAEAFVSYPMAVTNPVGFVAAVAAGAFVILFLLLKLIGSNAVLAVVLGLVAAGVAGWQANAYAGGLPNGDVPYHVNPMQGTNFWHHLDGTGVRMMGMQVASTFPPDDEPDNVQILSGLGVPDIGGSPGTWYVYTDDPWTLSDKDTQTGGKIIKVFEESAEPGKILAHVVGPKNYVALERFDARRDALTARLQAPGLSDAERAALEAQKSELETEKREWQRANKNDKVLVPFVMQVDRAGGSVAFAVDGGETFTVPVGGWSPLVPVDFVMAPSWKETGLVRFHVLRCDDEEVRVFVAPISIDPDGGSYLPISSPTAFSAQLAADVGAYETVGFGCLFNPLKDGKDSHFTAQSFLEDIASTMGGRERLLEEGLSRKDEWEIYFQIFYSTDRVQHMLYRESDPDHPAHDPAEATEIVTAFGREFPLSDSVRQMYMQADRITGALLDRIESGELGPDVLLLVVSDHGFTSFRRQVNLNNLLWDLGYLKTKDDIAPGDIVAGGSGRPRNNLLAFVDWSRTQAYSYGLGNVFVNLVGREPQGIVDPADYDALVASMQRDLLGAVDPATGQPFVTSAHSREELYSGPWWKEGPATFKSRGEVVQGKDGRFTEHDGFADIFLGYRPTYRVSWGNTMGGLDASAVTDNTNRWSGDHVSVDPSHVRGILFSNRPLSEPAQPGLIDIAPTLLARYGVDPAGTDMDGAVLPFADLTQ